MHQIAEVWHWCDDEKLKVRWKCACGFSPKHPTVRGKRMTMHEALRVSHFLHMRNMKRAAGLL